MTLSKETRQRIISNAEAHTNEFEAQILGKADTSNKESYLSGREDGYIAGAEKEAERAQGLVECLNSIKAIGHPDERVLNLIVLTLTKYNNSK